MKKYKYILFDLDGTISNSKEGITRCARYALGRLGIIEDNLDNLEHFIGPPMAQECMRYYGMAEEDAYRMLKYYREVYDSYGYRMMEIYPGIEKLLIDLCKDGYSCVIATSKPQRMAEKVVLELGITKYFELIKGADITKPHQDKADVILEAISLLEIEDKKSCLMVGDTVFDIAGAAKAGVDCVGIEYGFGNVEEMIDLGACAILKDTEDLYRYIKSTES